MALRPTTWATKRNEYQDTLVALQILYGRPHAARRLDRASIGTRPISPRKALRRAYALFGDRLRPLLDELPEVLIARRMAR